MEVSIPKHLALSGGKYNDEIHDWRLEGSTSVQVEDDIVVITSSGIVLSIPFACELAYDGGDVAIMPTYQIMPTSRLGENVPAALPNSTWIDEEGTTHHRTWLTWRDSTHQIRYSVDGTQAAFGLNSFGVDLKASEFKIIYDLNDPDITIYNQPDYMAEMAKPEWTPDGVI